MSQNDTPPEEPSDPSAVPQPAAGGGEPPRGKRRARTAFGGGWFGWFRSNIKLWGFLGFIVFVLVLFRHVVLPFVFAALLAFILAPLIGRLSQTDEGERRMPRGAAILLVYLVILAFLGVFLVALLPRLSQDMARLAREAPSLYEKLNDEWAPQAATWLEGKFPSLAPPPERAPEAVSATDVPLPPGTQFVITPLPDGRYAVELTDDGLAVTPRAGGGYAIERTDEAPPEQTTVDKIRTYAGKALMSTREQLQDAVAVGRRVVAGTIGAIFSFFIVLMIAAFILIDLGKFHGFVRGLVPAAFRDDYDVIAAGINRSLSGVIRGQVIICLLNGALTYVGLLIFSVKYSLILAVVATLLSLIPIFGSILSTIPIVLAALVSGDGGIDVSRGALILGWIIVIHFLEANLFNPKIMGTAARIHPVLVIFALLAGEHTYGLVGALLGVPVAAVIQVVFVYFREKTWKTDVAG